MVGPDDIEKANMLLYDTYHPDEPLHKHLGLTNAGRRIKDADRMVEEVVPKHLSMFALDPRGKPIGVAINNACHSSEMDQTSQEVGTRDNCRNKRTLYLSYCPTVWRRNTNQSWLFTTSSGEATMDLNLFSEPLLSDCRISTSTRSSRRTSSSASGWLEWRIARGGWGWPPSLSEGDPPQDIL